MRLRQIKVECYAGAQADETPRRFNLEGRTIEVGEVLERRTVPASGDWVRVRTTEGVEGWVIGRAVLPVPSTTP